jgi:DNA-binding Lrp family transcriptional regulator
MQPKQRAETLATGNSDSGSEQSRLVFAENSDVGLAAGHPPAAAESKSELTKLEKRLLNEFQRGFPLSHAPYADIACDLDVQEADVIACLRSLRDRGLLSRIGPVLAPKRIGTSTLAAMSVPEEALERIADLVNGFAEVNHNYEREHTINLWFVITTPNEIRLRQVLKEIETRAGYRVYNLPMLESYHIDLGFPLWC